MGSPCAEYVFTLVDGARHPVIIRERFEIGDIVGWGQLPFLALSDEQHHLFERWRGDWSAAGFRQTESQQGWPRDYFLWRWRNPNPGVALQRIDLVPRQAQVLIAAITLGLVDEDPLTHSGAVPVRVDFRSPELANRPLDSGPNDVQVTVDRGVAGYAYPLSRQSPVEFVEDTFAGWGQSPNTMSSPVYAEVAAVPSATLEVRTEAQSVDRVRWRDVLDQGAVEQRLRVAVVEEGRNWVETIVMDDAAGRCHVAFTSNRPTACRTNRTATTRTWRRTRTPGTAMLAATFGSASSLTRTSTVVVRVGFPAATCWWTWREATSTSRCAQQLRIVPGQQRLELRLRRWTDMNARRWFSGDTHVHFLSTQGSGGSASWRGRRGWAACREHRRGHSPTASALTCRRIRVGC